MRLAFSILKLILLFTLIYNIGVGNFAHGVEETAQQVAAACRGIEHSYANIQGLVQGQGVGQ
jgi:hypothetical protein